VSHETWPCIWDPVSIYTGRGSSSKVCLSQLCLLHNLLLLGLCTVCLGLALVAAATLVHLAIVDKLDGVGTCTLVLIAVLLCMAFDGAEGALLGVATQGGGLAKCVQSNATNEGAMVHCALDLLDLEGHLNICAHECLLAHEQQHKVAADVAGEGAKHSYDGKLFVKLNNVGGLQVQLLNTRASETQPATVWSNLSGFWTMEKRVLYMPKHMPGTCWLGS
jgi:hypothetical protein